MSVTEFARKIAAQYPGRFVAIVVLLLIATVMEMVGLALIIPVIGDFLGGSALSGGISQKVLDFIGFSAIDLPVLLAAFLMLMGVRTVLMFSSIYVIARIGTRIEKEMKSALLASLLNAKWGFHVGQNIGQLTNIIVRESQSNSVAVKYLGRYLSSIIVAVILLATSGAVAWEALLLAVVLVIPMILLARRINSLSRRVAIARIEANTTANAQVIETGSMMKLLKASADEDRALNRFQETVDRLASLQIKNAVYETILLVLPELFSSICAVLLIVLGYYYLDRPTSDIVLFSLLIYRAFNSIGRLQSQRRALITYIPGYEACHRLLQSALQEAEPSTQGRSFVDALKDGIELQAVGFEYDNANAAVLHDIDLVIERGAYVGLVGQSGSGKTTIVDLITGLFIPAVGKILIDGKDLNELDIHSWRERIAYVPQDPVLFNGTVRENILRDAGEPREITIEQACDLAHVSEFVAELPDGFETVVGDRGSRLSGGQRQRIAIARALMREPDLLIFDEATSGLDSQSELFIRNTLNQLKGKITVIAIAHRFSAIRDVDIIFVVKDGRIVESGTYNELSKLGGEFSQTLEDSKRTVGELASAEPDQTQ